jgi:hypothetical protein
MRQITQEVVNAFLNKTPYNKSNSSTDGKSLFLFGNKIAEHRKDGIYISNAGWPTNTTRERLNAIPNVSISLRRNEMTMDSHLIMILNGNFWDGKWVKVT